jgi:molybdate transport system substrate-binding protein
MISIGNAQTAASAEIKLLTAGAYRRVALALLPEFEKQTGHKVIVQNDTVGALVKRIDGGEAFDVVVVSPAALDELASNGKVVGNSRVNLARVGIGVMVKAGAPQPDISTVEAFKKTLLAAKSIAFIDPASGGSSGIYLAGLFSRLKILEQIMPKAKLIHGGLVADYIERGEAEIGIHQISEIMPAKGVTLVGPLPDEIQHYTTYAAALGAATKVTEPATALIKTLSGPLAEPVLKSRGMAPGF